MTAQNWMEKKTAAAVILNLILRCRFFHSYIYYHEFPAVAVAVPSLISINRFGWRKRVSYRIAYQVRHGCRWIGLHFKCSKLHFVLKQSRKFVTTNGIDINKHTHKRHTKTHCKWLSTNERRNTLCINTSCSE